MDFLRLFKEKPNSLDQEDKTKLHEDPRVQYFLECRSNLNLALPILEKILEKTLVLQNYTLSQGHCKGLAHSIGFFDEQQVNRIYMNNCGIDGSEFALILKGLQNLRDFKAITY